MQLLSVNIGTAQIMQIGDDSVSTGIYKRATPDLVQVSKQGLAGDVIGNQSDHGGSDQAIYLYSAEDYSWWSQELGVDLEPGVFGENLTLYGFGDALLKIGDQLQIGSVRLELTAPRIPCSRLAARMGDPTFVKRFTRARRPGSYARVIQPGSVRVGDTIEVHPALEPYPTIVEFSIFWGSHEKHPDEIKRYLDAPIAQRARAKLEGLLREQA